MRRRMCARMPKNARLHSQAFYFGRVVAPSSRTPFGHINGNEQANTNGHTRRQYHTNVKADTAKSAAPPALAGYATCEQGIVNGASLLMGILCSCIHLFVSVFVCPAHFCVYTYVHVCVRIRASSSLCTPLCLRLATMDVIYAIYAIYASACSHFTVAFVLPRFTEMRISLSEV